MAVLAVIRRMPRIELHTIPTCHKSEISSAARSTAVFPVALRYPYTSTELEECHV
jgi:hypothetical protein